MPDLELQTRVVASLFRGAAVTPDLFSIDPRAWRTDRFRAARLAQAALEHLPVSATVLLSREGAFEQLLKFCESGDFASVVEERAELVGSFAQYVRRLSVGWGLGPLLALDEALVDVGELQEPEPIRQDRWRLSVFCSVIDVPVATPEWHAERFGRIQAARGASLWERILSTASGGEVHAPADTGDRVAVLVVRNGHGRAGTVETLSPEMGELLRTLAVPRSIDELVGLFDGALTTADCAEILQGLLDDGIVGRGGEGRT